MAFNAKKYGMSRDAVLRDSRPTMQRCSDALQKSEYAIAIFVISTILLWKSSWALAFGDVIMLANALYFWWLTTREKGLSFKLPMGAKFKDPNNMGPGKNGEAEGILYLGNTENGDEMWFTNSDARTHILYLGTTGSGKTEGLKSMVTNAIAWGSGFVYVDGKADTDLWSSLSALVRRFGRDDDLLVLNYMTGNSDATAPSNTMNPFSSGSAGYLTNMLVELMPDGEGDNAMWKERAVSLCSAIMPILTYKRDTQDIPLSVRTIRDALSLNAVVKLQRDDTVPEVIREGVKGYLETLPGFVAAAFDDNGEIKPDGGDTTTASQQHGYLAMQFTRALQSLGDDYGYIFDTQAADVDMLDVVLNRRILVVLIPALEKSSDEIANLGKIVAATMKGMMGSTLGSTVEGTSDTVIENKPTHSATPFMTVFDEVGYYTASGMAVMAAQARSLGFSLVFSGQDLPAMKKRVREEANSITANCNIKIFGKLEDPTETKEFFEKSIGDEIVTEVSSFKTSGGAMNTYFDTKDAGIQHRAVMTYDELRSFKEGMAAVSFGGPTFKANMFYSNPGHAKAMRVTRFMALAPPDENLIKHAESLTSVRDKMVDKNWTAMNADVALEIPEEIAALQEGYRIAETAKAASVEKSISAIVHVHALDNPLDDYKEEKEEVPTTVPAAPTQTAPPLEPTTAPQIQAAQATPPEKTTAETKPGAPMNFFKKSELEKGDEGIPQETTPLAQREPQTPPSIELPPEITTAIEPKKQTLPTEITNILKTAGRDANKKLFSDSDKDNIDAAE